MGKFLKLITNGFMTGVSEPWCNNEGVAVLPGWGHLQLN